MSLVEAFFRERCKSRVYPSNFNKKDSNTEVFPYGFFTITFLKLLKHFLRDIFAKHCLTLSQPCKLTCLKKIYRASFLTLKVFILCKKLCLYWNADANANADVEMPMPRLPNGH